jgi:hypothetical protein
MNKQISKEIVINAEGESNNGNCVTTYCVEQNKFYTSMKDTAKGVGTSVSNVSLTVNRKQKTCNGYHICRADRIAEYFPDIVKYWDSLDLEEMKAKATAWDTYMASKNAKAKAKEELERKREIHIQLVEKANKATAKADKMLMEIQVLEGKLMEMEV